MCGIIASSAAPGARRLLPAARRSLDRARRAVQRGRRRPRPTSSPRPAAAADALLADARRACCRGAPTACALLVRDQRDGHPASARRAPRSATGSRAAEAAPRRRRRAPPADASRRPTPRCSRLKDALWAVERDRLPHRRRRCATWSGAGRVVVGDRGGTSIQQALSALDRLEVRGRDSAGLTVLVRDHGLDLDRPRHRPAACAAAAADPLFRSLAGAHGRGPPELRLQGGGRDRRAGRQHPGPARRHRRPTTCCAWRWRATPAAAIVLGHTRWASVGHHLPAQRPPARQRRGRAAPTGPYVTAALNGDVDNFADLKAADGLRIAAEITTDAKVIPTLVSRRLAEGADLADAFRDTVASFEGSVAIAASAGAAPRPPAARPAGQRPGALRRAWPTAATSWRSEPYGVVEETDTYLRLDGETPANPDNPTASRGQIVVLDGSRAGTLEGIAPPGLRRHRAAGHRRRPAAGAEITTRDIDRGDLPALPAQGDHRGAGQLPQDAAGQARRRGRTASTVAPRRRRAARRRPRPACATARIDRVHRDRPGHRRRRRPEPGRRARRAAARRPRCGSRPCPPPSCPGFGLRADMSDTLVVAISQSGTTTDTNRTVDLVRGPGRHGHRHRQPAQQRPHRQGRRRALHVRRARRRDERGVDQGVLRADRGRLPAGVRRSPTRSAAQRRPPRCSPALRDAARPRSRRPSPGAPQHRRGRPAAGAVASATGRSSATAPTASPPRSCGSSSPSSATSRSPATPPRTRSTSTCRPSR